MCLVSRKNAKKAKSGNESETANSVYGNVELAHIEDLKFQLQKHVAVLKVLFAHTFLREQVPETLVSSHGIL